jgi:Flp pilus assembly pilin Flp
MRIPMVPSLRGGGDRDAAPSSAVPASGRSRAATAESGQGMIEYALIGGILIIGAVAVLAALSKSINELFSAISSTLAQY